MPIPYYKLDDRGFDDLVKEMLERIPAHTPEWNSPQVGDPGRTLIDLFAWLGDTLLYRVNLIPERQRLVFLRLLNIPMRPAVPARGLVRLRGGKERAGEVITVPAATPLKGPVDFETTRESMVLPVEGAVYVKRRPDAAELVALKEVVQGLRSIYSGSALDPYITTPLFADGKADRQGFDFASNTLDSALWIALMAPEPEEASRKLSLDGLERHQGRTLLLNLGIAPRITVDDRFSEAGERENLKELLACHITTPRGGYLELRVVDDTTDGFTTNGVVQLELPDHSDIGLPGSDAQITEAGVGNRPPRLDDPERSGRVVAWLRLQPRQPLQSLAISWAGINVAEIDQRKSFSMLVLGSSDGNSDQTLALPGTSVDPASLFLEVEEPEMGYRTWERVDDLAAAGRDDAVYSLDPEAGSITFGDGVRGRVPTTGMRYRVARMRAGGGRQGNLGSGSLTAIGVPGLKVEQPLATEGGEDAETLEAAEKRIPGILRHGDRAVTEDDYRQLALQTPAVELGRVEVLPRFKPHQRNPDVPGIVSVMVLPDKPRTKPPYPRPDRLILERVHQYLDHRRPLGAELYVIGPEYIPLGLSVAVRVREGFGREQVLDAVDDALRDYLWSLTPGGFEGQGWPLGQRVLDRELEVVVARVQGVRVVNGVELFQRDSRGRWVGLREGGLTGAQELALEPWQLPELLAVAVIEGRSPQDSPLRGGGAGDTSGTASGEVGENEMLPIPVVPEVC